MYCKNTEIVDNIDFANCQHRGPRQGIPSNYNVVSKEVFFNSDIMFNYNPDYFDVSDNFVNGSKGIAVMSRHTDGMIFIVEPDGLMILSDPEVKRLSKFEQSTMLRILAEESVDNFLGIHIGALISSELITQIDVVDFGHEFPNAFIGYIVQNSNYIPDLQITVEIFGDMKKRYKILSMISLDASDDVVYEFERILQSVTQVIS